MIALLLNHLWQSSLCVGAAGLVALALRGNGANVRFWVWFAASIKFLVPFAALTALGAYALTPMVSPVAVPTVRLAEPFAAPFSTPAATQITESLTGPPAPRPVPARPALLVHATPARPTQPALPSFQLDLESALLALWAAGFLALAIRWLVRWSRLRALLRDAMDAQIGAPVAVKFSASRLEPGLVGILHPVILLPQGIGQHLSPAELKAVLAHELCHWRRQDNLLAAIHMLVEALFWFFPLVWWLGARLNAERERACDEAVLTDGNDPQIYAEGILKVCRAYLQSPIACVAGVSGACLKKRMETIMENRLILRLNAARKFVLSASAGAALALPLGLGLMASPVTQMQAKAAAAPFLPIKSAQGRTGQASAVDPAASAAAIPTDQVAEIPAVGQAPQTNEAATGGDGTPPSSHLSRSLPAANLAALLPDLSRLLPRETLSTPQPISTNNAPPAMIRLASNAASAPAAQTAAARTCTLPKIADTAALEEIPGTDLMTVPVKVNGTDKRFLLDIGTNPTEVSQATIAQLGLPQSRKLGGTIGAGDTNMGGLTSMNRTDLSSLTNGGLKDVPIYDVGGSQGSNAMGTPVRIDSFTIGGATAPNMEFLAANDADMGSKSEPYDGLLTGDFFKQYDVELDFGRKQINWLTPTTCTDPDQVVFWSHSAVAAIPMTVMNGKMVVPVTIEGHEINAVIDTSSSRTLMRRDIAELELGLKPDTDMKLDNDLKDGKGGPVYVHTFSQISFAGGVTANNVPALILTDSLTHELNSGVVLGSRARSTDARIPDLTLGMDVLHQLHMYIVPGQGRIYVTSAEASD